jgi:hypothetical protein
MKEKRQQIIDIICRTWLTPSEQAELVLNLFDVSGSSQPLTIKNVSKMLGKVSKETWIAAQGDEHGWKEWWSDRNKLRINNDDR